MKKLPVVLRVFVAFLLAILLPCGLVAPERSLFEKDEKTTTTEKKPAVPKVEVPRTEEASKLARQLITKLNESYFSLERAGIDRFNATFEVKCKTGVTGTVAFGWNRRDGGVVAEAGRRSSDAQKRSRKDPANDLLTAFTAPLLVSGMGDFVDKATVAKALRKMEVDIVSTSLRELILPFLVRGPFEGLPRPGPGVYAVKAGDEFVIDASEQASKDDSAVKTNVLFVSADSHRLRSFLVVLFGDNEVLMETVCEGEAAESKLFIKSLTAAVNHPWMGSVKGEYKLTYTHTQGSVFLKRAVGTGSLGSEPFWSATAVLKDVRLVGRPAGDTTRQ